MTVPSCSAVSASLDQPAQLIAALRGELRQLRFDSITEQPGAAPFIMQLTNTVTYLGRERIEAAFGTFETCRPAASR
ncbi:MAG TPA: hypothetical protein VGE28_16590 [Pseudomonas sp.]